MFVLLFVCFFLPEDDSIHIVIGMIIHNAWFNLANIV